jgi:hypothetical protein
MLYRHFLMTRKKRRKEDQKQYKMNLEDLDGAAGSG